MASPVPTPPHKFGGPFYEPITSSEEEFAPNTPLTENQDTELERQEVKVENRDPNREQKAANLESQDATTPANPRLAKRLRRRGDYSLYWIMAGQSIFVVVTFMLLSFDFRQCTARRPFYCE